MCIRRPSIAASISFSLPKRPYDSTPSRSDARAGIGAALMRHLAAIARSAGLHELIAEVLPDNAPMLKVFEKCGFGLRTKRESGVVHVALRLS